MAVFEAVNVFDLVFSSSDADCDAKYYFLFEDAGASIVYSNSAISLSIADAVSPEPTVISA